MRAAPFTDSTCYTSPSLSSSSSRVSFLPRVRDADARKRSENGGRRRLFSTDAAVLLLAELAALPRRVRTGRAPTGLERRLARASPGIRAFRAPQRHLYLHRLGTMPSDQGTQGGPYPELRLAP